MAIGDGAAPHPQRLEALHDLLPAVVGALDVDEIVKHLRRFGEQIVPFDEATLALLVEDGRRFRYYNTSRTGTPNVVPSAPQWPLCDLSEAHLIENIPFDGDAWAG